MKKALPASDDQDMPVAEINSNTACDGAVAIIKREHRSLGYLVHTLLRMLRDVSARRTDADFSLIASMLYYVEAFPDSCHHPKEEEYLFRLLRARTAIADGVLDGLHDQHMAFSSMITSVGQAFVHWQGGAPNGLQPFSQAVTTYADMLWDHIDREENQVLVLAREHLTGDDWRLIYAAFSANDDPLFGPHIRDEFAKLRFRIVNDLPPGIMYQPER